MRRPYLVGLALLLGIALACVAITASHTPAPAYNGLPADSAPRHTTAPLAGGETERGTAQDTTRPKRERARPRANADEAPEPAAEFWSLKARVDIAGSARFARATGFGAGGLAVHVLWLRPLSDEPGDYLAYEFTLYERDEDWRYVLQVLRDELPDQPETGLWQAQVCGEWAETSGYWRPGDSGTWADAPFAITPQFSPGLIDLGTIKPSDEPWGEDGWLVCGRLMHSSGVPLAATEALLLGWEFDGEPSHRAWYDTYDHNSAQISASADGWFAATLFAEVPPEVCGWALRPWCQFASSSNGVLDRFLAKATPVSIQNRCIDFGDIVIGGPALRMTVDAATLAPGVLRAAEPEDNFTDVWVSAELKGREAQVDYEFHAGCLSIACALPPDDYGYKAQAGSGKLFFFDQAGSVRVAEDKLYEVTLRFERPAQSIMVTTVDEQGIALEAVIHTELTQPDGTLIKCSFDAPQEVPVDPAWVTRVHAVADIRDHDPHPPVEQPPGFQTSVWYCLVSETVEVPLGSPPIMLVLRVVAEVQLMPLAEVSLIADLPARPVAEADGWGDCRVCLLDAAGKVVEHQTAFLDLSRQEVKLRFLPIPGPCRLELHGGMSWGFSAPLAVSATFEFTPDAAGRVRLPDIGAPPWPVPTTQGTMNILCGGQNVSCHVPVVFAPGAEPKLEVLFSGSVHLVVNNTHAFRSMRLDCMPVGIMDGDQLIPFQVIPPTKEYKVFELRLELPVRLEVTLSYHDEPARSFRVATTADGGGSGTGRCESVAFAYASPGAVVVRAYWDEPDSKYYDSGSTVASAEDVQVRRGEVTKLALRCDKTRVAFTWPSSAGDEEWDVFRVVDGRESWEANIWGDDGDGYLLWLEDGKYVARPSVGQQSSLVEFFEVAGQKELSVTLPGIPDQEEVELLIQFDTSKIALSTAYLNIQILAATDDTAKSSLPYYDNIAELYGYYDRLEPQGLRITGLPKGARRVVQAWICESEDGPVLFHIAPVLVHLRDSRNTVKTTLRPMVVLDDEWKYIEIRDLGAVSQYALRTEYRDRLPAGSHQLGFYRWIDEDDGPTRVLVHTAWVNIPADHEGPFKVPPALRAELLASGIIEVEEED